MSRSPKQDRVIMQLHMLLRDVSQRSRLDCMFYIFLYFAVWSTGYCISPVKETLRNPPKLHQTNKNILPERKTLNTLHTTHKYLESDSRIVFRGIKPNIWLSVINSECCCNVCLSLIPPKKHTVVDFQYKVCVGGYTCYRLGLSMVRLERL